MYFDTTAVFRKFEIYNVKASGTFFCYFFLDHIFSNPGTFHFCSFLCCLCQLHTLLWDGGDGGGGGGGFLGSIAQLVQQL